MKRWMALARLVLIGGIFPWALPGSVDYLLFLWRERTPVLGLRLDVIYSCFGLFLAAVILRAAGTIVNSSGRSGAGRFRRPVHRHHPLVPASGTRTGCHRLAHSN